jgi:hypothetical protein
VKIVHIERISGRSGMSSMYWVDYIDGMQAELICE